MKQYSQLKADYQVKGLELRERNSCVCAALWSDFTLETSGGGQSLINVGGKKWL